MKTVQVRKKAILMVGVLAFVTLVMSGCLKEASSSTTTPKTYLSLMHLAPWAPPIEVWFDNTKASSAINPGTVSTSYSALAPGAFGINFKKSGGDSIVAALSSSIYDSSRYYTLMLYNTDSMHVSAAKIHDDYSVLTTDKSFFRFFHVALEVGNVDVYLDNTLVASSRNYVDNTFTDYYNQFTSVTPGTYTVSVKKAGADSLIGQVSVPMIQSNAYTIYLRGKKSGTGVTAIGVDYLTAN